jgi:hypothetical protein
MIYIKYRKNKKKNNLYLKIFEKIDEFFFNYNKNFNLFQSFPMQSLN